MVAQPKLWSHLFGKAVRKKARRSGQALVRDRIRTVKEVKKVLSALMVYATSQFPCPACLPCRGAHACSKRGPSCCIRQAACSRFVPQAHPWQTAGNRCDPRGRKSGPRDGLNVLHGAYPSRTVAAHEKGPSCKGRAFHGSSSDVDHSCAGASPPVAGASPSAALSPASGAAASAVAAAALSAASLAVRASARSWDFLVSTATRSW